MLDEYISYHARTRPNAPAIMGLERITFRKLEQDIRRAAFALGDLKAEPGQSVAVALQTPYLDWVMNLALSRLGTASGPADDIESEYRVTDNAQATGANVLVLGADQLRAIESGPERRQMRRWAHPDALGRIFRTSGTTGEPKRIAISWRVLGANIMDTIAWHGSRPGLWWVTTGERTPFGYYIMLAAHVCGYPAAVGMGPNIAAMLQLKPRLLGLLPVHIQWLLDLIPADHPKWPLTLISAGSAIPPQMAEQVGQRLTNHVINGYGATETSGVSVGGLGLLQRHPLATGYLLPGVHVRLLDDAGEEVPPGELGRICVSSEKLATGYAGDPEGTARHFRDGWFHSTDLGRLTDDGLLFLEGRADELMNLGGHKILPGTIDVAVSACPGVKEAAAFAVPGKRGIDQCGIAVVAGQGFDEARVRAAAATKLMTAQRTKIMLVDALPRNVMGKVERLKLRAMWESFLAAHAAER